MSGLTFNQVDDGESWHSSMHEDDRRSLSTDSSASSGPGSSAAWANEKALSGYRSNSISMDFHEPSTQPQDTSAYYYKSSTEVIDPNLTLNHLEPALYEYKEPSIKFEFTCFSQMDDGGYEHEPYSPESPTGTRYAHYEHEHTHTHTHQPLPAFDDNWSIRAIRKVPVTRSQSQNDGRNQSQASQKGPGNGASRSNKSPRSPLSPTLRKTIRRRGSASSDESPAKPNNRPKKYKKKVPYHFCEEDPCKSKRVIFKNKSELKKHIETQHTKPYICIFGFANCRQRFGARNEWKRHIATQHLVLYKYVCDHPDCIEKNKAKTVFNRGDLFMKHQERMHSPANINDRSPDDLELISWKKQAKDAKSRCETLRPPPQRMTCGFCSDVFEHGDKTWMELIDHVGLHYQNDPTIQSVYQDDLDLMAWMKHHNLIKPDEDSMDVDSETPTSRKTRRYSDSSSDSSSARQIKQEQMEQ